MNVLNRWLPRRAVLQLDDADRAIPVAGADVEVADQTAWASEFGTMRRIGGVVGQLVLGDPFIPTPRYLPLKFWADVGRIAVDLHKPRRPIKGLPVVGPVLVRVSDEAFQRSRRLARLSFRPKPRCASQSAEERNVFRVLSRKSISSGVR